MSKRESPDTLDGAVAAISRTPSRPPRKPSTDELVTLERFVENVPALRKAWLTLANANVEHLKHIKRIERRFVWLATFLLLQSLIVLVGIGGAVAFNREAQHEAIETRRESTLTRQSVDRATTKLGLVAAALNEFLEAQGAANEAVAKEIQAEATNDPQDERDAVEAAVEAERQTLQARRAVAEPHERGEVERKLERVERRARKMRQSAGIPTTD